MSTNLRSQSLLALATLGVVYGDVGTSPLYTMSVCFERVPVTLLNILGITSLIFWTLIIVVSTCYVSIFLNATNHGEGGVLALLGVFEKKQKKYHFLFLVGIFGAGLLISDGILTPAISVLSSVEGLEVISPEFSHLIVPITVAILLVLFFCQRFGVEKIGRLFGPILLIWFSTLALIGLRQILLHPLILKAVNPIYAIQFFRANGFTGWLTLGSVFLCITGAEAMYADIGQFGKTPMRLSWFFVVLPGLMLSFFGEGANLLEHPSAIKNAFYLSAPSWCHYPLLILATIATIIASQSIISASYSMTKQGILLDIMPRLKLFQTSAQHAGQIYVPQITLLFAIGTIALVLFFKSSHELAGAYGLAINLEMVAMTLFVIYFTYEKWHWSLLKIFAVFGIFSFIILAFLSANLFKIPKGGWMPIALSFVVLIIMQSWHKGLSILKTSFQKTQKNHVEATPAPGPLNQLLDLQAILITNVYDQTGLCFLKYFENMHARPTQWLVVTVAIQSIPRVSEKHRFSLEKSEAGNYHLTVHFGFMESTDLPSKLAQANENQLLPFKLNLEKSIYFVEDIAIHASESREESWLTYWEKRLFAFLFSSTSGTLSALEYFKLPRDQTVTIGAYADF